MGRTFSSTTLDHAMRHEELEMVKELMAIGAHVTTEAIGEACRRNNMHIMRYVMRENLIPNTVDLKEVLEYTVSGKRTNRMLAFLLGHHWPKSEDALTEAIKSKNPYAIHALL